MTGKPVWLTIGTTRRLVDVWYRKPKLNGDGTISGRLLTSLCIEGFERATGMTLEPGKPVKVRFKIELEDE